MLRCHQKVRDLIGKRFLIAHILVVGLNISELRILIMRAEIETLVDEIRQAISLLRRHL